MNKLLNTIIMLISFVSLMACTTKSKEQSQYQEVEERTDTVALASSIYDQLLIELDSAEIYDDSILYGYWFKPHEASSVNIFFHKNGTFEFKYYIVLNDTTIIDVVKKGTFTISDADASNTRAIKMISDDGCDDKAFKGKVLYKRNDTSFYLSDEESGLYLVKGSD